MVRVLSRLSLALVLPAFLVSCASVSVMSVIPTPQEQPDHKPRRIFVAPFTFDDAIVKVDRDGEKLDEFQREFQAQMVSNLVERLPKAIASASPMPDDGSWPEGDVWMITGKFTQINQGSRFLRSAIGFGSGGTKLNTTMQVTNLAHGASEPFVIIETSGGSNAYPGAILGVISWPMILSGANGLIAGVTGDSRRTSRELISALTDYLREKGIPVNPDTARPKLKGHLNWLPPKKATSSSEGE